MGQVSPIEKRVVTHREKISHLWKGNYSPGLESWSVLALCTLGELLHVFMPKFCSLGNEGTRLLLKGVLILICHHFYLWMVLSFENGEGPIVSMHKVI